MPYEMIEHTADIGIRVWGESLSELFESAGKAITSVLIGGKVEAEEEIQISLNSDNVEELFHDWLSEINYFFMVREKVFCEFKIIEISETKIEALCKGETFCKSRHDYHTEIKAITYHQFFVKHEKDGWHAQVFLDL